MRRRATTLFLVVMALAAPASGYAQRLGTFRWQLQPYCNVVTVSVTQDGGLYRLDGTDDQCGGGRDRASVVGMAFLNPDGSIGFGLTTVTAPGGAPVHVDAKIALSTLSGTWRDSAGATGPFTFTPGTAASGNPRPAPVTVVPAAIALRTDGAIVASGSGSGPVPASGPGTRMMWYPTKAAFRAGVVSSTEWDDPSIGAFSMALGNDTVASGLGSFAAGVRTSAVGIHSVSLGFGTAASGVQSTAMGSATTASGFYSTAMGVLTTASGTGSFASGEYSLASGGYSTAHGVRTTASGQYSTALGEASIASGAHSLAAGYQAEAAGTGAIAIGRLATAIGNNSVVLGRGFATVDATGSFVFGDRSTFSAVAAFAPNTFVVRAAGGARFFSNAAETLGPVLLVNGSDWQAVSDVNRKHLFRELDHEDVLARLARMPVTEWSYKDQDPEIRHIGPTAQDFHAAFGLGQDPLLIGTLDADGVALAAVRALEARTRALQDQARALGAEARALGDENRVLSEENRALREGLERLVREVDELKRRLQE